VRVSLIAGDEPSLRESDQMLMPVQFPDYFVITNHAEI
jgi:hypothetical protein